MNNKIKRILPQLLTILFVVFVFGFFTINAQVNMDNRGIDFGFGFLSQEASFDMQFTLLDYDGQDSYLWAWIRKDTCQKQKCWNRLFLSVHRSSW